MHGIVTDNLQIAMGFAQRMVRDACQPHIAYRTTSATNSNSNSISGITVYAGDSNECDVPIPVTVPGGVKDAKGSRIEQIGTDPETIWVQLDGSPVLFDLITPIPL